MAELVGTWLLTRGWGKGLGQAFCITSGCWLMLDTMVDYAVWMLSVFTQALTC